MPTASQKKGRRPLLQARCPIKQNKAHIERPAASKAGYRRGSIGGEWFAMEERWLSVEEIATHLGISRDTVYKWIVRKRLPAHKVGKLWKFSTKEVDEWVRFQAGPAKADARTRGPATGAHRRE